MSHLQEFQTIVWQQSKIKKT